MGASCDCLVLVERLARLLEKKARRRGWMCGERWKPSLLVLAGTLLGYPPTPRELERATGYTGLLRQLYSCMRKIAERAGVPAPSLADIAEAYVSRAALALGLGPGEAAEAQRLARRYYEDGGLAEPWTVAVAAAAHAAGLHYSAAATAAGANPRSVLAAAKRMQAAEAAAPS